MKKMLFTLALLLVAFTAHANPVGGSQAYLTCPDGNHPHLIDLGLPSGTKWSCCNVEAGKPEDYGGYYAWGETEEKDSYSLNYYIHYKDGSWADIGIDIAGTEYDVAHVKWGGLWAMPSNDQCQELFENCTSEWTTVNGVDGRVFTGTNGGSIFLPAAGYGIGNGSELTGSDGFYWSSTQNPSHSYYAYYLYFSSDNAGWYNRSNNRYIGHTVRPVQPNLDGDINHDGVINVTDVTLLVNKILGVPNPFDESQAYLDCPDDHHPHLIDLGLPSSTKWACCNVEADKPEAYGGHYAWGETEEKSTYNWSTYIHCKGSKETCDDLGSDIAGTQYDVARVKWGGSWVMPSDDQCCELLDYCTSEWTTVNGVNGRIFTGSNGGSIFLPATGYGGYGGPNVVNTSGPYWSSTQDPWYPHYAYGLGFSWDYSESFGYFRYEGLSVRPVSKMAYAYSNLDGDMNHDGVISITDVTLLVNKILGVPNPGEKPQDYLTCPDGNHPHLIDLGLPSGTKWACCNVNAAKPEAYGGYYAWGETEKKDSYSQYYYIHYKDGSWADIGSDIAGTQYDVAHVKWGGLWVMPCNDQCQELFDNCTSEWTTVNGVDGRVFTGSNGGSIFLPAAGYRIGNGSELVGSDGFYWSSTQDPSHSYCANYLYFSSGDSDWKNRSSYRYIGHTVRPVYGTPLALSANLIFHLSSFHP